MAAQVVLQPVAQGEAEPMRSRRRGVATTGLCAATLAALSLCAAQPARADKKEDKLLASIGASIGMIAAGAALTGGLYGGSLVVRDDAAALADELAAKNYAAPCTSDPAACREIDGELEKAERLRIASIAMLAVTGLGALSTLGLVAEAATKNTGSAQGPHVASVVVVPIVTQRDVGAAVTVTW